MCNMTTSQLTRSYLLSGENDWFWGSQVLPASSEMVKVPPVPRRCGGDDHCLGWLQMGGRYRACRLLELVGCIDSDRLLVDLDCIDKWILVLTDGWLLADCWWFITINRNWHPPTILHHLFWYSYIFLSPLPVLIHAVHDMIWFESHDQYCWIRLTPR